MALAALDRSDYLGWEANIPAMKALRARLAQPEPEPVQVSPQEFIAAVTGKENLVGIPVMMSVWPTKEKNNG